MKLYLLTLSKSSEEMTNRYEANQSGKRSMLLLMRLSTDLVQNIRELLMPIHCQDCSSLLGTRETPCSGQTIHFPNLALTKRFSSSLTMTPRHYGCGHLCLEKSMITMRSCLLRVSCSLPLTHSNAKPNLINLLSKPSGAHEEISMLLRLLS
jgi:hypothetical protein